MKPTCRNAISFISYQSNGFFACFSWRAGQNMLWISSLLFHCFVPITGEPLPPFSLAASPQVCFPTTRMMVDASMARLHFFLSSLHGRPMAAVLAPRLPPPSGRPSWLDAPSSTPRHQRSRSLPVSSSATRWSNITELDFERADVLGQLGPVELHERLRAASPSHRPCASSLAQPVPMAMLPLVLT